MLGGELKSTWKSELSYKDTRVLFSLDGNYLRHSNTSRHKCCCFDSDNLLRFTRMVKCIPECWYFYFVLNK